MSRRPRPDPVGPGQESVWDYPRPPVLRACDKRVRVVFDGQLVADTSAAICVLETSHPPSYYLPPADVDQGMLCPAGGAGSHCEWKGMASYYDIVATGRRVQRAAWAYPDPVGDFASIRAYLCFYARFMDACYVGEDRVLPQPGGFYGGWISPEIVGPFKGVVGSDGW